MSNLFFDNDVIFENKRAIKQHLETGKPIPEETLENIVSIFEYILENADENDGAGYFHADEYDEDYNDSEDEPDYEEDDFEANGYSRIDPDDEENY